MNQIVLSIVLTTFFGAFAIYYYHQPQNKDRKLFRQSLSNNIFFSTFLAPLVAAALFSFIISMIYRETDRETFFRSDVIILTSLFYLYGVYSVSQGIHAVAKIFKPEVVRVKDQELMKMLRFFHGPFSHYLSNSTFTLILSLILLFNVNHPSREVLSSLVIGVVVLSGLVLGVCMAIGYATGSTVKYLRWFLLLVFLFCSYYEITSRETIVHSPVSLVVLTCFATSLVIFYLDLLGPKRNWFQRLVDKKLLSVNADWSQIFSQFYSQLGKKSAK